MTVLKTKMISWSCSKCKVLFEDVILKDDSIATLFIYTYIIIWECLTQTTGLYMICYVVCFRFVASSAGWRENL